MSSRRLLIEDDSGGAANGNINSDPKRETVISADLNASNPDANNRDISSETQELDNSGGRIDSGMAR